MSIKYIDWPRIFLTYATRLAFLTFRINILHINYELPLFFHSVMPFLYSSTTFFFQIPDIYQQYNYELQLTKATMSFPFVSVFGIGNIVFLGTSIHANMSVSKDCGFRELIYPHWLHLLFLLVQTFFIFKYNHVSKYGLMQKRRQFTDIRGLGFKPIDYLD